MENASMNRLSFAESVTIYHYLSIKIFLFILTSSEMAGDWPKVKRIIGLPCDDAADDNDVTTGCSESRKVIAFKRMCRGD